MPLRCKGAFLIAVSWLTLLPICQVSASPDTMRAAILDTAAEAALATASLSKEGNVDSSIKSEFRILLSERSWVISVKGGLGNNPIEYGIRGFLWGDDGQDRLVTYVGTGSIANVPLQINGTAMWKYDSKLSKYTAMNIDNVVKIGEHSVWGWIKGSEIVVGGTLGAATGAESIPTLIIGAGAGAEAVVFISDTTREVVESLNSTPKPPANPPAPSVPEKGQSPPSKDDQIVVAVSEEAITGWGPNRDLTLSGSVNRDAGAGFLRGR